MFTYYLQIVSLEPDTTIRRTACKTEGPDPVHALGTAAADLGIPPYEILSASIMHSDDPFDSDSPAPARVLHRDKDL